MTRPRFLTPESILKLFTAIRWEGPRPGKRIGHALAHSAESRKRCRHLLHLFEEDCREHATLWDVYLAHYRWEGKRRWRQWAEELVPENLTEAFTRLEQATPALLWGLVEGLCLTSRRLARSDPKTAEALGKRAVALASRVPIDVLDSQCRDEISALAYATLGNAYRTQDRVPEARKAMDKAQQRLDRVPARPLGLTAAILSLRAALEAWERRYLESLDTLHEALTLKMSDAMRAKILIKLGNIRMTLGKPVEALSDLHQALRIINRAEASHLWFCAAHNLSWVLTELGRHEEAVELLPELNRLSETVGGPVERLRLRWVEARLAAKQERETEAEGLYIEIRSSFLQQNLPYGAAVVTLDLARLLFEQGRLEEVKAQVVSTLAEFQRQQVEPELISALTLLEEAALGQRLTLEVLRQAREIIERQEARPRR